MVKSLEIAAVDDIERSDKSLWKRKKRTDFSSKISLNLHTAPTFPPSP